ncbi:hypothetical protein [Helicobacter pylori]|uniref:hypothetical protein n=1 Tax=Helicobacter pylori TaxID=210 RepID=UPI0013CDE913|nr:hypothetical protein [Helicobacter pylori]
MRQALLYFDGKKRFLTFLKFDNQRPIKKQSQKFSLTNSKLEKKRLKLCLEKKNER